MLCYISGKVTFGNFLPEKKLRDEYLKASIFCLCSTKENPGAVRGEAMAMAVPIITTATSGSEMVKGRGIVIPIGDEKALTTGLEKLMSDPQLRRKIGYLERKWAERLRADLVVKKMLSELGYVVK